MRSFSIKRIITPRAFEHWQRDLGFSQRLKIQAWQYAKHPLRALNFFLPGYTLRLERIENKIQFLQQVPALAAPSRQKPLSPPTYLSTEEPFRSFAYQGMIRYLRNVAKMDLEKLFKGKRILDVGCHDGTDVVRLRENFGAEAYGLDMGIKPKSGVLYLCSGKVTDLPFADGIFDVVFSKFLLDLLTADEIAKFTPEAFRVLKPGGLFLHFCSLPKKLEEPLFRSIREAGFNGKHISSHVFIFEKPKLVS